MPTETQIAASRTNVRSFSLYSTADFVRPEEQALYAEFCAGFAAELAPEGALEHTLSAEIIHAAWRLRRCSAIEAAMNADKTGLDPSLDRVRGQAHRILLRSMAELRRLQAERARTEPAKPAATKRSQSPAAAAPTAAAPAAAAPAISPGNFPRNALCPCNSGVKFKRCCGRGAPAVLNLAA